MLEAPDVGIGIRNYQIDSASVVGIRYWHPALESGIGVRRWNPALASGAGIRGHADSCAIGKEKPASEISRNRCQRKQRDQLKILVGILLASVLEIASLHAQSHLHIFGSSLHLDRLRV